MVVESRPCPPVVVDDRERLPYEFPSWVPGRLPTGDYSLVGFESEVAVERKSKEDAYRSLGADRDRFEAEVKRLSEFRYPALVIESSLPDFLVPPPLSSMHPRAAIATLLAWSVRYRLPIFFCGDRWHAQALVGHVLRFYWRYHGDNRGGGLEADRDCPGEADGG